MSYSGRSIRHFVEHELGSLPHFVIYAILEWTLIGLLFLDGLFAFVSSEFADFFDLQSPCVLCTRIDHILTRNKSRYCYNEAICDGHKKDFSSLAYCQAHRKLSDINTMCEGCLLSFATDNSYKSDTNKDIGGLQLQPHWNDSGNGNGNLIYCSCCGEPMKVKPKGEYQNTTGNGGNVANNSGFLSSVPSRLSQQAPTPSPCPSFGSRRGEEARRTLELSHIRCKELKMPGTTTHEEDDTTNVSTPTVSKEELRPIATPRQLEPEDSTEDYVRTPTFARGNRFFGISDSAASSPRFANRMPRKSLLEKVELASDPIDAIAGDEIDTDVILDRLKKQVRSDKKSLIALYMELDEERSASAVAANNAMAMITKLQAEKASVQMEALQYQRMMEEQAEYDKEDIQMLKDFLSKKEDEIRDLESELDFYRDRHGLPHVSRNDGMERSQSFSSTTDHGSPLFSIEATDAEMEVHDHISEKDGSEFSYGEGETSGQKFNDSDYDYQNKDDYAGGSTYEGENIKPESDNDGLEHHVNEVDETSNEENISI